MTQTAAGEPNKSTRSDAFEQITEEILAELARQDLLREEALALSRRIIRSASLTIRATHRAEFAEAAEILGSARQDLTRLEGIAQACPIFTAIGYVSDAQKEYAEACITYALIHGDPLPRPTDLHVPVAPYLNALGETAGELRRSILDALRQDILGPCEARLGVMQQIYEFLATVDYPDALTGGLRRTTDALRRILENTRADLTTARRQKTLQEALERLEERLPAS
jgi:translin